MVVAVIVTVVVAVAMTVFGATSKYGGIFRVWLRPLICLCAKSWCIGSHNVHLADRTQFENQLDECGIAASNNQAISAAILDA